MFDKHKYCAECGQAMKVERKEFFSRETGKAVHIMVRKKCPSHDGTAISAHDFTVWTYDNAN